jgi:hypothetical protein
LKVFGALPEKFGGQIFSHQVWQPKAIEIFWSPKMAIESEKKLVTNFFKHCPK